MQAVPSTYHQLLRFPTERGIEQIRGSQKSETPREPEVNSIEVLDRESLDDIGQLLREKATEALDRVKIAGNLDRFFMVGASLNEVDRQHLITFLLGNLDIFAWSRYEMPGIDPSVSQHHLNVDPKYRPII